MRHVRLPRLKKEILQPHPSPGHRERKRPPALSHTGNFGSSVHPPGPPGSRDPWEKNLRQRNESGQRPVISDTNRAKNEKNGALSATLSRADQIIQKESIDHCPKTSTIGPGTHNVIDAGKPGASQGTHRDRRRCALTGLTQAAGFPRVNFPYLFLDDTPGELTTMASAAQIEANRRNAQKSSGPKTEKGKARVRCNALKHGMTAVTTMPGLTHEDPDQLREKTLRLIDDLQPSNEAELDQVCQAARLTLAIERADRFEMAHMNQRIREAARERVQEVNPRPLEEIQELGRRLLHISAAEEVKFPRQLLWSDDPRLLVAKLEASAEGCRWLLARWAEFRILLDRGARWDTPTLLRFIQLQGKQVAESVYDPVLNVIFVAWDVLVPKFAAEEWENFREERFRTDPSFNHRQCWREIVARPSNAAEAREVLDTIIADHVENLKELLARNEAIEAVADPDWADRAALDLSPGFERLRRYQSAKTRKLQRTLDALRKLRNADFGIGNGEKADGKCQMADGKCQMADGKCQMADGKCQMADGKCQMADDECQVAPGEPKSPIQNPKSPRVVETGGCEEGLSSEPMKEGGSGPVVGHDSIRVIEGSTNDRIGILSHEGAVAADWLGQGDGGVEGPEKAQNKANLGLTQTTKSEGVKSHIARVDGRKQSQLASDEVRGARRAARKAEGTERAGSARVPPLHFSAEPQSRSSAGPGE